MDDIGYDWFNQYSGKIRTSNMTLDGDYYSDDRKLEALGIRNTTDNYWYSARVYKDHGNDFIIIKIISTAREEYMMNFNNGEYFKQDSHTYKVRPVITIDSESILYYNEAENIYNITK